MIRSPRQAPAGASARPLTRATAAPAMAMTTPTLLRRSSASTPSAAPTSMVIKGKVESASEPPRRGGVTKCQIEQHDEERKIHDTERGDGEPIAAARPFDPQRERDRQQQQKSNAKSEHAQRDRIARPDRKPRGAARHAAQRARRDCRQHADILVSQSAHAKSGERA